MIYDALGTLNAITMELVYYTNLNLTGVQKETELQKAYS